MLNTNFSLPGITLDNQEVNEKNIPFEQKVYKDPLFFQECELVELEKRFHQQLSEKAEELGIYDSEGTLLKQPQELIPSLPKEQVENFIYKFKSLDLFQILFLIGDALKLYPQDLRPFARIIGSYADNVAGADLALTICQLQGLDLEIFCKENKIDFETFRKETLAPIFGKYSDIDLEIDLPEAKEEDLKEYGDNIVEIVRREYPSILIEGLERSPYVGAEKIYHGFTLWINYEKVDISLISKDNSTFFGGCDFHFPISMNLLMECENYVKESLECKIVPFMRPSGKQFGGWQAFPLKIMQKLWVKDSNLNYPGVVRFWASASQESMNRNPEQIEQFLKKILALIKNDPEGAKDILTKILGKKEINHMPAYISLCFLLQFLSNEALKPVGLESVFLMKKISSFPQSGTEGLFALHELLKPAENGNRTVPTDYLCALLLTCSTLYEQHKKTLGLPEKFSLAPSKIGNLPIKYLKFNTEGISLTLPHSLLQALKTLNSFVNVKFANQEHIQALVNIFYPPMDQFPIDQLLKKTEYPEEFKHTAEAIADISLKLLESEQLCSIGFLMVCFCGEILKTKKFLAGLTEKLPGLLVSSSPNKRVIIFLLFLRYYKCVVDPSTDLFFRNHKKIQPFCELLKVRKGFEDTLIVPLFKLLIQIKEPSIFQVVIRNWIGLLHSKNQILSDRDFIDHSLELINFLLPKNYPKDLSESFSKHPQFALEFLYTLSKCEIIQYKNIESKLFEICSEFEKIFNLETALRLYTICTDTIERNAGKSSSRAALKVVEFLIKQSLISEAVELLNKIEEHLAVPQEIEKRRLEIVRSYLLENKLEEAFEQWKTAFEIAPDASVTFLLDWKKGDGTQDYRENLFSWMIYGCTDRLKMPIRKELLEGVVKYIHSVDLEKRLNLRKQLLEKGHWLFENYKKIMLIPASHPSLRANYVNFLEMDFELPSASVQNLVGAHQFLNLISDTSQEKHIGGIDLAKEMLESSSLDMQESGFTLLCRFKEYLITNEAFKELTTLFLTFLLKESSRSRWMGLLTSYKRAFNDLSTKEKWELFEGAVKKETKRKLDVELVQFLSTFSHPETFNILFWYKTQALEYNLELIGLYFFTQCSEVKVLCENLERHPLLDFKHLDQLISRVVQPLGLEDDLSKDALSMLYSLIVKRITLSEKITEKIVQNIHKVIEILFKHLPEEGCKLFSLIEQREDFFLVSPERRQLFQFQASQQLFASRNYNEAFKTWKNAAKGELSESSTQLLISWQEERECSPELLEIMLIGCHLSASHSHALKLAERCVPNICNLKEYPCLKGWLMKYTPALIRILKGSSKEGLLNLLFEYLSDPLLQLEKFALYDYFTMQIDNSHTRDQTLNWLKKAYTKESFPNLKSSQMNWSRFYLTVSRSCLEEDRNMSEFYLRKAFTCNRTLFTESDLDLTFKCFQAFVDHKEFGKALDILKIMGRIFSKVQTKRRLEAWVLIILELAKSSPLQNVSILTSKADDFKEYGLQSEVMDTVVSLVSSVLKERKCVNDALNLAFLYSFDAFFWEHAFSDLVAYDETTLWVLEKLAKAEDPFVFTSSNDLSEALKLKQKQTLSRCWEFFLIQCYQQRKSLFSHFFTKYQIILDQLNDVNTKKDEKNPYFCLFFGIISQISTERLEETKKDALRLCLHDILIVILNDENLNFNEFITSYLEALLQKPSFFGLEMATKVLISFKEKKLRSHRGFDPFMKKSLAHFYELKIPFDDEIGKNLQELLFDNYSLKEFIKDNVEGIELVKFILDQNLLEYLTANINFIQSTIGNYSDQSVEMLTKEIPAFELIRNQKSALNFPLTASSSMSLTQKPLNGIFSKEHFKEIILAILEKLNLSKLESQSLQILSLPNLKSIFTPDELSREWAKCLEASLKLGLVDLTLCISHADRLTGTGQHEMDCLNGFILFLLFMYKDNRNIDKYKHYLFEFMKKFCGNELREISKKWNSQLPKTKDSFERLQIEESGETFLKSRTQRFLNEIECKFSEEFLVDLPSHSETQEVGVFPKTKFFIEAFVLSLVKMSRVDDDYFSFICANLYFIMSQSPLFFENKFSGLWDLCYICCFLATENSLTVKMHQKIIGHFYEKIRELEKDSLPEFYINLLKNGRYDIKPPLKPNVQIEVISNIVTDVCIKGYEASNLYKVIKIMETSQAHIFTNYASEWEKCYEKIIEAVEKNPFIPIDLWEEGESGVKGLHIFYYLGNSLIKTAAADFVQNTSAFHPKMVSLLNMYIKKAMVIYENKRQLLSQEIANSEIPQAAGMYTLKVYEGRSYFDLDKQLREILKLQKVKCHRNFLILLKKIIPDLLDTIQPLAISGKASRKAYAELMKDALISI